MWLTGLVVLQHVGSFWTRDQTQVSSLACEFFITEPPGKLLDFILECEGIHWISSIQSLSPVRLFATTWTAVHQVSLSITNSRSLLKLMFIESVMPSNHFILCHLLLLLPSIFPSIRIFSNESALRTRWPKYWSFSIYFCFIDYTKERTDINIWMQSSKE